MENLLPDNLAGQPMSPDLPSLLTPLHWSMLAAGGIQADILRLDLIHPVISGNKWFKLKGYLRQATQQPGRRIITFGGPWSNHLVATACAARLTGLSATGIVRGEEPPRWSATLKAARDYGMQLEFISRREYSRKDGPGFLEQLSRRYSGAYIIPEGGSGMTGIRGSEDILRMIHAEKYTHILCAVGTGTMFLGLVRASSPGQTVIGIPVLKGIDRLSILDPSHILDAGQTARARLLPQYHFGGYARHPQPLLDFINDFHRETGVPSDIVYTGKLFYAIRDSTLRDYFPASARLLIIHSGGLQGNLSLPSGSLHF